MTPDFKTTAETAKMFQQTITLDTVPSTGMLKPVTKYCSDCKHMRKGVTKCGPAVFCQHPLVTKHGISKFRSEFCTVDQELYVPKLSRFARLVANIYRFVKKGVNKI